MDILTLELHGLSLYQAMLEARSALDAHPDMALRLYLDKDETLRHNLHRLLEKEGRAVTTVKEGPGWRIDAATGAVNVLHAPHPAPPPLAPAFGSTLRPVLLLRSSLGSGDRSLGRRLLLETLRELDPATPWVCLAHEALELLVDERGLAALHELQARGIPVKLSQASLDALAMDGEGFEVVEDRGWQSLLGRGGITAL